MSSKKNFPVLLSDTTDAAQASFWRGYKRFWPFMRKYLFWAVLGMLLTIPIGALDAVVTSFLRPFMDKVMVEQDKAFAYDVPLYILAFALGQGILLYISSLVNSYVGGRISCDMKQMLFKKLLGMDTAFYDKNNTGTINFRYASDVDTASSALMDNLKLFLTKFFSSVSLIGVLLYNSWQLSIAALGMLVFLIIPMAKVRRRIKKITNDSVRVGTQVVTLYNETYDGVRIIKSFNLLDYMNRRFDNVVQYIFKLNMKLIRDTNWLPPVMHLVTAIGVALVLYFGMTLILDKIITPGAFVAFLSALIMLYTPIKSIGKNYINVQKALLAIDRIYELLGIDSYESEELSDILEKEERQSSEKKSNACQNNNTVATGGSDFNDASVEENPCNKSADSSSLFVNDSKNGDFQEKNDTSLNVPSEINSSEKDGINIEVISPVNDASLVNNDLDTSNFTKNYLNSSNAETSALKDHFKNDDKRDVNNHLSKTQSTQSSVVTTTIKTVEDDISIEKNRPDPANNFENSNHKSLVPSRATEQAGLSFTKDKEISSNQIFLEKNKCTSPVARGTVSHEDGTATNANATEAQQSAFNKENSETIGNNASSENNSGKIELTDIKSDITFSHVFFRYLNDGPWILNDISFSVKAGTKVALVGNSGGGKSTVCSLIPHLYDVDDGVISIDGRNINDYSLASLRSNMAMVFQDNFLFEGTIKDNLLMGKLDATQDEIDNAIKSAYLDEVVAKFDRGLDQFIGERGILLSGGQKQRLAIARAIIKNAPLVILDEATSALDNKSEKIVQKALDMLMQGKTTIVIAHRLSTIMDADKILVINDGQIVEQGTHIELLEKDGAYASLYRSQFSKLQSDRR